MPAEHQLRTGVADQLRRIYQFSSVTQSCPTLCDPMNRTNSWSLLKLMFIESVRPSNHLTLCRPLLLLPSIFPSIRDFSSESVLHIRWPKYWSFSFSISPSSEHPGLISFRMDWLSLLIGSPWSWYLISMKQKEFMAPENFLGALNPIMASHPLISNALLCLRG